MVGERSYKLKEEKDKVQGSRKTVRARMQLMTHLYFNFRDLDEVQSDIQLPNLQVICIEKKSFLL